MSKGSGSTRVKSPSNGSKYTGGGTFELSDGSKATSRMNQMVSSISEFAKSKGASYGNTGGMFQRFDGDDNVQSTNISIGSTVNDGKIELFYTASISSSRLPGQNTTEEYRNLRNSIEGVRYTTIEQAYNAVENVRKKMNKIKL